MKFVRPDEGYIRFLDTELTVFPCSPLPAPVKRVQMSVLLISKPNGNARQSRVCQLSLPANAYEKMKATYEQMKARLYRWDFHDKALKAASDKRRRAKTRRNKR